MYTFRSNSISINLRLPLRVAMRENVGSASPIDHRDENVLVAETFFTFPCKSN